MVHSNPPQDQNLGAIRSDHLRKRLADCRQPAFIMERDGSLFFCNEAFTELLGCNCPTMHNGLTVPPVLVSWLRDLAAELNPSSWCQHLQKHLSLYDRLLWLDLFVVRFDYSHAEKGGVYFVYLVDLTRQKQEEEKLRRSEVLHRLIAENAYDMITLIEPQTNQYLYISPSHERVLGYTAQDLLGRSWGDLIHPDDLDYTWEVLESGRVSGSGVALYRHQKKDGGYAWLYSVGNIIRDTEYQGILLLVARDVTEQMKAESALKVSEERYRLIVNNAHDGISIADSHTFFTTYQNPALNSMLGYSLADLQSKTIAELVHPEDWAMVADKIAQGISEGQGDLQCRLLRKDGTVIWAEISGTLLSKDRPDSQYLFITRDVSERKLAEEQLKKSEEKYRLIADNTQDLILLVDPFTQRCTYASPSSERILGYREEDLAGLNLINFIHPDDRNNVLQISTPIITQGKESFQYRLQRKDGSYVWVESIGKIFRNTEGVWQILISTRDISERKQAEAALLASESRLRNSQEELKHRLDYLNYLINNMNEIFVTYDRQQIITFANSGTKGTLGYLPSDLIGHSILSFVAESQKKNMAQQIEQRLLKGGSSTFETLLLRKDNSEVLVRIKGSPIIEQDEITGAMVLVEDISEHRKLEKEMARLDQLNTVGEMAAGIGHEIRNPMTTVKGFLQLLGQDEELSAYKDYFKIMLEELERANSIISEFLSLAKNKLVNLQPRNLNQLISAIYPLLRADAMLSDKTISLNLQAVPDLMLDEAEIRQLLVNLVRNALEAMPGGGKVLVSTFVENMEVVLTVTDEGSGIDSALLDKLGTPFLTTKEDGTGLGLAICYSIVSHHQATIHPISSPQGTTMVVRFAIPPG